MSQMDMGEVAVAGQAVALAHWHAVRVDLASDTRNVEAVRTDPVVPSCRSLGTPSQQPCIVTNSLDLCIAASSQSLSASASASSEEHHLTLVSCTSFAYKLEQRSDYEALWVVIV